CHQHRAHRRDRRHLRRPYELTRDQMMQTQAPSENAAAVPGDASPVISVRNLRMGYGARVLLDNASFDVRRGEIVVILGGSGSGKSSLMKNLIGLYKPMA